jgi:hypothetical protein
MFNCNACERYWSFDDINNHKNEERCKKDKKADNLIEKLAIRAPKQAAGSKKVEDKLKPEGRNLFVLTMNNATLIRIEEYITGSKLIRSYPIPKGVVFAKDLQYF